MLRYSMSDTLTLAPSLNVLLTWSSSLPPRSTKHTGYVGTYRSAQSCELVSMTDAGLGPIGGEFYTYFLASDW